MMIPNKSMILKSNFLPQPITNQTSNSPLKNKTIITQSRLPQSNFLQQSNFENRPPAANYISLRSNKHINSNYIPNIHNQRNIVLSQSPSRIVVKSPSPSKIVIRSPSYEKENEVYLERYNYDNNKSSIINGFQGIKRTMKLS